MCKRKIYLITKNNRKTKKNCSILLPDLFMEARPPATARQPPMRRGNPTAGREKKINTQQHSNAMQQYQTSILTKGGGYLSQGFGFEIA